MRRSETSIPEAKTDEAGYGVRLVGPGGRTEPEIPLRSADVAGALREVCLHSLDRGGYELWREGRLILGVYRAPEQG